jgi:hypothetical protein
MDGDGGMKRMTAVIHDNRIRIFRAGSDRTLSGGFLTITDPGEKVTVSSFPS